MKKKWIRRTIVCVEISLLMLLTGYGSENGQSSEIDRQLKEIVQEETQAETVTERAEAEEVSEEVQAEAVAEGAETEPVSGEVQAETVTEGPQAEVVLEERSTVRRSSRRENLRF